MRCLARAKRSARAFCRSWSAALGEEEDVGVVVVVEVAVSGVGVVVVVVVVVEGLKMEGVVVAMLELRVATGGALVDVVAAEVAAPPAAALGEDKVVWGDSAPPADKSDTEGIRVFLGKDLHLARRRFAFLPLLLLSASFLIFFLRLPLLLFRLDCGGCGFSANVVASLVVSSPMGF